MNSRTLTGRNCRDGIDRVDRDVARAFVVGKDLHQLAGGELGADIPGRAQADADSGQHRFAHHFRRVGHQRAVRGGRRPAVRSFQTP
jgi:hypothetical protein